MNIKSEKNSCVLSADLFFSKIDKIIENDLKSPPQMALDVIDALHEMFTTQESSNGFAVKNTWDNGDDADILKDVTKEYWDAVIYDDMLRSGNNISFFDLENSRKSFMIILGACILTNIPEDLIAARLHIKRQIAATFNGMNFYNKGFRLTYIDYNFIDGESSETDDISGYLIV